MTMRQETRWYRAEIEAAAREHGLDADLVEAVVLTESSGLANAYRFEPDFFRRYMEGKPQWIGANPRRVSASYGLMQVMLPVAVELGYVGEPEGLFVPSVALDVGCQKLASLLKWSGGNVDAALASYNGGKVGNDKPPYRNTSYVTKVKAALLQVKHGRVNP
jgi:soluble lytic murein transglycosylase-like protein